MTSGSSNILKDAVSLVLEAANKYPQRTAVELHRESHTYQELIETASGIAAYIRLQPDRCPFVGVVADKSFYCYASVLGVLMAGKAYLPLNPRFPEARNRYMVEKAGVNVVLDSALVKNIKPVSIFQAESRPTAYLLFTSGTTGHPKGVPVSHSNLAAYLHFMLKNYDFNHEDRFSQIFDLTFDLSVHDMFLAWASGACLCVPAENSSFVMSKFIREKEPTVWFSVPSLVNLMGRMRLLKQDAFPSIRLSFFCGEALKTQTALDWKQAASRSRMVNLYGPTEATIAITRYDLPHEPAFWKSELGIVSIGRIFYGNSFKINKLSRNHDQGELLLTGNQVVDGYFENEMADRTSFFIDHYTDKKFYRTGDLVRMDKDDDLFYIGRKDSEVKISGYRVNLKEIENLLETYETVNQAVVIYEQSDEEAENLKAFILRSGEDNPKDDQELFAFCRENLPWYMVPGKFIFVDDIPLNVNGKVDKTALLKIFHHGK